MIFRKSHQDSERRKYIRLDSVFPVAFKLLTWDEKQVLSDWLQGFTNNIGKGGLCLSINNLDARILELIKSQNVKLSLNIEIPLTKTEVPALAKIVWLKDIAGMPNKYLIGLNYEEIDAYRNIKIMRYAWTKKLFFPLVLSAIIILVLGFALNSFINLKLVRANKTLVSQLVKILQESSIAKQKIKQISKDREDLELKIQTLQLRLQGLEEEKIKSDKEAKLEELNALIKKLTQEKAALQEQLIAIQSKENIVTEELLDLDERKVTLQKANLDKMYQWLMVHQNPSTGLVVSFEGDSLVSHWAFTYDQSLVAQAYINFSDFPRARKILDFFARKAKRQDKLFLNAYYFNDGSPAEYVVHSGPNIWLGIAILQYTKKTKDLRYIGLAEDIAQNIIYLQSQDKDGGIRGGPNVSWYSTEHNLDAYAFFNMLYQINNKQDYLQARDKILNWLRLHTYDKLDIPVKRGKGDSTIATDTYAWSIAAIGPEKLEELEMHPDRILEFAEENCAIEVDYRRPEGNTIKIKGFDFAPRRHIARGGVVSSEWTAQMVLAFKIMADFYYKNDLIAKARSFEQKADEYLAQLSNMIISSPSPSGQGEGCLPYASQDYVDTGHGWMTPQGKSTGSVAATTLYLFAYYKYNPLKLNENEF